MDNWVRKGQEGGKHWEKSTRRELGEPRDHALVNTGPSTGSSQRKRAREAADNPISPDLLV